MPHTQSGPRLTRLHDALEEVATLKAEIARLRTLLASANRQSVKVHASKPIAGFGRDWSQGFSNPVLSVSLQEVYPAQQQELLSA